MTKKLFSDIVPLSTAICGLQLHIYFRHARQTYNTVKRYTESYKVALAVASNPCICRNQASL